VFASSQGIDLIAGGRNKKTSRTAPKSDNVYVKLLVKVRVIVFVAMRSMRGVRRRRCDGGARTRASMVDARAFRP
jgi:hypothetical protein